MSQVLDLLWYAMPCTTATASACLPRDNRNLGDSNRWKKKNRHTNMKNVRAPMVRMKYLQPQLFSLPQQGWMPPVRLQLWSVCAQE